jgi:hypothetical protein
VAEDSAENYKYILANKLNLKAQNNYFHLSFVEDTEGGCKIMAKS